MRLAEVDEAAEEVDEDADRADGRMASGLGVLEGQVARTRVRRARVVGRRLLVLKAARRPEVEARVQHKNLGGGGSTGASGRCHGQTRKKNP